MAMVDYLAGNLSDLTGTKFEVLRGREPILKNGRVGQGPMRYSLKATRDGHIHYFQSGRPMKIQELTRWLASICDMVQMGFIPLRK